MTINGDPLWAEALSLANIFFGITLAVCGVMFTRHRRGFYRVLTIFIVLIGLYWTGIYVYVILTPSGGANSIWFGQVLIRPMFTFSLATMASVAIYRVRSKKF